MLSVCVAMMETLTVILCVCVCVCLCGMCVVCVVVYVRCVLWLLRGTSVCCLESYSAALLCVHLDVTKYRICRPGLLDRCHRDGETWASWTGVTVMERSVRAFWTGVTVMERPGH